MDFVFAILISALSPFVFNYYGVKHTPNFGILLSDNTFLSKFMVSPIALNPENDYKVQKVTYNGSHKLDYEIMFDDKVNLNASNFWLAVHTSWSPLQHQLLTIIKSPNVTNPIAKAIYMSEGIGSGLKIGYDFNFGSENTLFAISPYAGISFMQIAYEGSGYYSSSASYDSALKYIVGLDIRADYNWHFILEASGYKLNYRGITDNKQDMQVNVLKLKAGVVYHLNNLLEANTVKKDKVYDEIVSAIDPYLQERQIELQKKEDNAKKELKIQQAKSEAIKKQQVKVVSPVQKNSKQTTTQKPKVQTPSVVQNKQETVIEKKPEATNIEKEDNANKKSKDDFIIDDDF